MQFLGGIIVQGIFLLFMIVVILSVGFNLYRLVKRRVKPGAASFSGQNYFFDLIEKARDNNWQASEEGRQSVKINGEENGLAFEIEASMEIKRTSFRKKTKSSVEEEISVFFELETPKEFYITSGNLLGLLGEKIISTGDYRVNGATVVGESSPLVEQFILRSKPVLEYLFRETSFVSEVYFEEGKMEAALLYDTNADGETEISAIVQKLSVLAQNYNRLVGGNG